MTIDRDNARALIEKARAIAGKKATFDDRFILTLADALEAALSAVPVVDDSQVEYGVRADGDEEPYTLVSEDRARVLDDALWEDGDVLVRRRKAGPWEVVPDAE